MRQPRQQQPEPARDETSAHAEGSPAPAFAIEIEGLGKTYAATRRSPAKRALDEVSLRVPRGSFFALLGPNGAGKSTLINILAGLVVKSEGRVSLFGVDIDARPRRARRLIGVVPQELNIDAFFTPRETLELQAGLYGVPAPLRRTDEILAAMGLSDKGDAYARSLSGGMRRRLLIAKALVHRPPVVILDEPTAGVDVELRRSLWAYMQALNRDGITVVLTTHYLEEAEALCDWVAIIDRGKVVACDRKETLLRQLDEKELAIRPTVPLSALPEPLAAAGAMLDGQGRIVFRFRPSGATAGELLDLVRGCDIRIADLATREADLEDLFLRLTGHRPQAHAP